MDSKLSQAEEICIACGLCCNGVIFADVHLQPGDLPEQLRKAGLPLKPFGKKSSVPHASASELKCKFNQPCSAFEGRCRIYAIRPQHCREFECALLKGVNAGNVERTKAERVIQTAHRRAEKVRKLLRQMGEQSESLALSKRFQRVQKRMISEPFDDTMAETFGDLTLAVHDLNVLLSDVFYPGR